MHLNATWPTTFPLQFVPRSIIVVAERKGNEQYRFRYSYLRLLVTACAFFCPADYLPFLQLATLWLFSLATANFKLALIYLNLSFLSTQ
jgi:hypothetical protein